MQTMLCCKQRLLAGPSLAQWQSGGVDVLQGGRIGSGGGAAAFGSRVSRGNPLEVKNMHSAAYAFPDLL